jgi:hypothetical protein
MRRFTRMALIGLTLALVAAGPVAADQVYHTERLTLNPVGNPPALGSGMVVNIHPNGPQRYAIEQYQLRHGEPNSRYQVALHLYVGAADCSEAPAGSLDTAVIRTNRAGNGTAQLVLTPENIAAAGLVAGMSFPINWTLSQGATTTHETRCTFVILD